MELFIKEIGNILRLLLNEFKGRKMEEEKNMNRFICLNFLGSPKFFIFLLFSFFGRNI